ncbi:hypothetical protein AOA57_11940 [Pseudomonas sp. 2588-5]|nr:hypothetical protein AOA57_11940 [Pseudomonas sp. 2588-5]
MIILKKTRLADVVRLTGAAMRGEHLNDERVIYVQANRIKIHTDDNLQLNLDGEFGGNLPGEFINLPRHINMIVPDKKLTCFKELK